MDYGTSKQDSDDLGSLSSSRARLISAADPTAGSSNSSKTGCSIVQIDFPAASSSSRAKTSVPSSSSKSASYLKGASSKKVSKLSKKMLGSKDNARRLKNKGNVSKTIEDMNDNPLLCITPMGTPRVEGLGGYGATSAPEAYDQGNSSSEEEEDVWDIVHDPRVYTQMAGQTRSIYRFEKLAYPDLNGARGADDLEPLFNRKFGVQR